METMIAGLRRFIEAHNPLWGIDFDGTLVPLVADPERARLGAEQIRLLESFASRHETAVISGRGLEDLRAHVPVGNMHFVGNHGAQVLLRDGRTWEWWSDRWVHWREQAMPRISALVQEHGGWLEDKRLSLALHYRGAVDATWWVREGESTLEPIVGRDARIMHGIQSWNVVPDGAPHKGTAAVRLCEQTGHDSIVYFGDETTDESVFTVTELPVYSVKVGQGETAARHRLESPEQVWSVLRMLI